MIPIAWTAPRTWASGEIVTAANLNTHVRDNLLYLITKLVRVNVALTYASTVTIGNTEATVLTMAVTDALFPTTDYYYLAWANLVANPNANNLNDVSVRIRHNATGGTIVGFEQQRSLGTNNRMSFATLTYPVNVASGAITVYVRAATSGADTVDINYTGITTSYGALSFSGES